MFIHFDPCIKVPLFPIFKRCYWYWNYWFDIFQQGLNRTLSTFSNLLRSGSFEALKQNPDSSNSSESAIKNDSSRFSTSRFSVATGDFYHRGLEAKYLTFRKVFDLKLFNFDPCIETLLVRKCKEVLNIFDLSRYSSSTYSLTISSIFSIKASTESLRPVQE